MTKIDIFSGFLGAGKTTLIKKLLEEAYKGEKIVLIENEFGEIGIDGGFLKDAGIEINEMNSGCICCSLVGDFGEALKKVLVDFAPDRILIEPSGVGKLSDVIKAVMDIDSQDIILNSSTAVVDAKKCKVYMKNFGEFYNNQIENAGCIVLSHTADMSEEKLEAVIQMVREKNKNASIVSTPWEDLNGLKILESMEGINALEVDLKKLEEEEICPECGGHHHHEHEGCCEHEHHHDHDECCGHNHHHHEHEGCCEHGHHHEHHHNHDEHCHHEHHHHEHDKHCCSCHDHKHEHGHHHADEVFASWGTETAARYTKEEIETALEKLGNETVYGQILRAKGIVAEKSGKWIHFDYIPGEVDIRFGAADVIGRLCVIGARINSEEIQKLFLK